MIGMTWMRLLERLPVIGVLEKLRYKTDYKREILFKTLTL
jgi:hypothetical protein